MNITEEQKQEANSVLIRILVDIIDYIEPEYQEELSKKLAIQDRQSVLEAVQHTYRNTLPHDAVFHIVSEQIQSLTNQISYLKSKI
jgi:hypothetical protein